MTAAPRFVLPFQTVIDAAGVPLPEAQLEFWYSGTSLHATTYADADLTTPNTNPVIANLAGRFGNIFLNPAVAYKVRLSNADGVEQWTADPVTALSLYYPVACEFLGSSPTSSEQMARHYFTSNVTFPANFSGSGGSVRLPPASALACTVTNQDGDPIGTMTIDDGGVFSFTTQDGLAKTFSIGDTLVVTGPSVAVSGMADAAFTFVGVAA